MLTGAASLLVAMAPTHLKFKSLSEGDWSGPGISFTHDGGFANIQLDCARISAPLPHGLPPAGKFVLDGNRQPAIPGPQRVESSNGAADSVRAHIVGRVVGKRMLLTITSPGMKSARYRLDLGGGPGPVRCL